jgi:plastocyanin
MHRRMRPLLLIAALTLGLAACGGDDDGGAQGASDAACGSGTVTITMVDIKFDPADATAGVGQEVCWVNEDGIDHNVVANSGATFKSDLFGKGKTFSAPADKPGTIAYECTIHPGMTGTIEVSRR